MEFLKSGLSLDALRKNGPVGSYINVGKAMKHNIFTYLILIGVIALSFGISYLVPMDELMKGVIASPGIMALFSTLFQLMRDQVSYEKQLDLQSRQFQFTLGAASHIANTAFDKHVEFCEKYMEEVYKAVGTLYVHGETEKVLENAGELHHLRNKYTAWLTDEINENLGKFEAALRKLGANAHFISVTTDSPSHSQQRSLVINNNFELYQDILGFDKKEINEDYAVKAVEKKIREILGTEHLSKLRKHLIFEASKILDGKGT